MSGRDGDVPTEVLGSACCGIATEGAGIAGATGAAGGVTEGAVVSAAVGFAGATTGGACPATTVD
jgi:hypothetical protein